MQLHAESDIDRAIAELKTAASAGSPCEIERDIAELIARDFSLKARLERARRLHRRRRHLLRHQHLAKALELAA